MFVRVSFLPVLSLCFGARDVLAPELELSTQSLYAGFVLGALDALQPDLDDVLLVLLGLEALGVAVFD
jgi:hypothetical protein